MATRQALLDDVNLRYRNTFTTDQKLVWANDGERELFDILAIDAPPYGFLTVAGSFFYPIPDDVDIDRIKVMTIQANSDDTKYTEIPFKRNDDDVSGWERTYWYSIVERNFYLNIPGGPESNRTVYVYHDSLPEEWATGNLNASPATPIRYQPLLKLYILEQIAAARKDVVMKNNFAMEREKLLADYEWQMQINQPEFVSPADANPKVSHGRYNRFETWFNGR